MSKKILVVDDDLEILSCIQILLEDLSCEMMIAHNGEEALSVMKEIMPDLIISDVMMPQMNGFVLCDKVKNSPEYSSIPIILLTSRDDESNKYFSDFTEPDIYMKKPFDAPLLMENVRNLLEREEKDF